MIVFDVVPGGTPLHFQSSMASQSVKLQAAHKQITITSIWSRYFAVETTALQKSMKIFKYLKDCWKPWKNDTLREIRYLISKFWPSILHLTSQDVLRLEGEIGLPSTEPTDYSIYNYPLEIKETTCFLMPCEALVSIGFRIKKKQVFIKSLKLLSEKRFFIIIRMCKMYIYNHVEG